jgi:ferredoxin-thioredoxin reductase catalytic subunit
LRVKVSDNKELVNEIRTKLKENNGYCPCSIIKNEDTICPCKNFREQKELGECHCGLYIKIEE